jgi:cell division protein FtsB
LLARTASPFGLRAPTPAHAQHARLCTNTAANSLKNKKMIVPVLIFSVPIVAILGNIYYKIQKLKYENNTETNDIDKLKKQVMYLEAEQETLHERISALENGQRTEINQPNKERRSDYLRRDDGKY